MVCDQCEEEYGKNEEQCSDCPANCLECSYDEGTMMCGKCSTKYFISSGDCESKIIKCLSF